MSRVSHRWTGQFAALIVGFVTAVSGQADALSAVQILREGGCGGTLPAAAPVHHNTSLDRAAEQWASGSLIAAATQHSGYSARSAAAVHISGPQASTLQLLRQAGCTVADRNLRDIGVFQRGQDTWLLLATTFVVPGGPGTASKPAVPAPIPTAVLPSPAMAARVLQLVNDVRSRGARCGERSFAPAGPVRASDALDSVASGHAIDMARHNYFEHEDLDGHTPADRVRAAGYKEKLVGENIAYGPQSADEVVQGWLDSPGHCENIMDPRFSEMGIALASGQTSRHGLYWVQLLVTPRS